MVSGPGAWPPRTARGLSPEAPAVRRLCRRLGLGLILVGRRGDTVAIVEEPVPGYFFPDAI